MCSNIVEKTPQTIVERLLEMDIQTIFVPLPETYPSISQLSQAVYDNLPFTREFLKFFSTMMDSFY